MGPRTLCNACVSVARRAVRDAADRQGLVHMKLQRKKRKLEEKEAAKKAEAEKKGAGA